MKLKVQIFVVMTASLLAASCLAQPEAEHAAIDGPFASPMEVTMKCLSCHEDAAHQVMQTTHWTWESKQELKGEKVMRGKKNAINNFCISISGNWPRCTSCHVGYGWKDASFDFSDQSRVDCLVCHDTTGTYEKFPAGAGMPYGYAAVKTKKSVDLLHVARNVGIPNRDNCISCHGFGGGGNNVKHGDIDSSMKRPSRQYDVHMAVDGADFTCQQCHRTENHFIKGDAMAVTPAGNNHLDCTDCHDAAPHKEGLLNQHMAKVTCQVCHIPHFAKEIPTKLSWDWSTAGKEIEPMTDSLGKETYAKKKGNFVWGKNVKPVYAWYNGKADAYSPGEKIDPATITKLNWPEGDRKDPAAKIYPFKVHRGKQIYDTKYNILITPKVFGPQSDPDAYWVTYDWGKAAAAGMKASGLPYSGEYGFAPTEMYWRINHMVVPKEQALGCLDCHGDHGRMDWKELGYEHDPMRAKLAAKE